MKKKMINAWVLILGRVVGWLAINGNWVLMLTPKIGISGHLLVRSDLLRQGS